MKEVKEVQVGCLACVCLMSSNMRKPSLGLLGLDIMLDEQSWQLGKASELQLNLQGERFCGTLHP